MPHTEQFFTDLAIDNRQAALLVAQVGSAPTELQLITQIAEYDDTAGGLRPIQSYIIRVLGVLEHRISNFGITSHDIQIVDDHPLLYEYITKPTAVFFRGNCARPEAVIMDIAQAHANVFYPWRHFPRYLNYEQPLLDLFTNGGGLLGQMPAPLAERVVQILAHHGLESKTTEGEPYIALHDNPALLQSTLKALLLGDSYFVSYGFSIQAMQGKNKSI